MTRLVPAILSAILTAAIFAGCSLIVGEKKESYDTQEQSGVSENAGNAVSFSGGAGVVTSENYRARIIVGGSPVIGMI